MATPRHVNGPGGCRNCGAPGGFPCRPGHRCAAWRAGGCGPTEAEKRAARSTAAYARAERRLFNLFWRAAAEEAVALMPNPNQARQALRRLGAL